MSKARAKGTAAESAVVDYLRRHGFPRAERRALSGAHDRGDIAGVDSDVVIEVKNRKVIDLAAFVDEATIEAINADAEFGAAWIKRRGTTDPGRWYVAMSGATFASLLRHALGIDEETDHG